jgi:hypothetical protein
VSLTCSMDEAGRVSLWITRESGLLPTNGCHVEGCESCDVAPSGPLPPRGYIVLEFPYSVSGGTRPLSRVFFARWCEEAVRVLDWVLSIPSESRVGRRKRTVLLIAAGAGSSGDACLCTAETICRGCTEVCAEEGLFVCQDLFGGDHPINREHWFRGCSDGVGELEDGRPWLSWPCRGPRLEEIERLCYDGGKPLCGDLVDVAGAYTGRT